MPKLAARDLRKESAWRLRLGRQAESGQSVRAWCRKHRVTETAFYWWRRELARRDAERKRSARRGAGRQAASFVPVHVSDAPVSVSGESAWGGDQHGGDSEIEIVLTDGRRVRITGRVPGQALADVLDVLERRPC